jgi:ATP-dependent protease Clp ATPase subunit
MPLVFGLVPDTVGRLLVFTALSASKSVDTNDSIEVKAMSKPQVTSDVRDEKRGLLMGMNL